MSVYSVFETLCTIGEILLCIWLFCRPYEKRAHFLLRATLSAVGAMSLYCAGAWLGSFAIEIRQETFFFSQFAAFVGLLVLCVLLVMLCYRISIWNALFCCTAGYTVQNLASGLHGFAMILLGYAGVKSMPSTSGIIAIDPAVTLVSLVVTSVTVIATCYVLYVRKIDRAGLIEVENRSMLLAAIAVMMFEIAFDLVNKGLSQPVGIERLNDFPRCF